MQINTAKDLQGLWAAVPTPWNDQGNLQLDCLVRNVEKYASIPMDGVYTTDSDGEFYAIELPDFIRLVTTFAHAMNQTSMPAAVGVTWSHTGGIIDRIKACLDVGIRAVHVAFPFWMPMAPSDVPHFWEDLAKAVPDSRWIHYATPRAHRMLTGKDYAQIWKNYPEQFIGTKLGFFSLHEMVDCIENAPQVSHLVTDYVTVPAMMVGARGTCSYWANTLPHWTRRMTDLCFEGKWELAMQMQRRLLVWETQSVSRIREAGHLHGIVGKARAALSNFLEDSGVTKPPYYPVNPQLQQSLKAAFDEYWAGET